jgi:hypothetical protein
VDQDHASGKGYRLRADRAGVILRRRMIADSKRYADAIARFDAANAEDPNTESIGGVAEPKELVYARRMTAMLERFAPDAPEAVRLAVRCQHIRRWDFPRDSYPRTPEGYQAWRTRLLDHHAELAARILRDAGYDEDMIARVASTVRKERLKSNSEAQMLEDVVGLVFLEHYVAGFVAGHPQYSEAKLRDILQKTFRKMSPRGRDAARTLIRLPEALAPFVLAAAGDEGRGRTGTGPRS